jgi:trimeric autotransporter adhesin
MKSGAISAGRTPRLLARARLAAARGAPRVVIIAWTLSLGCGGGDGLGGKISGPDPTRPAAVASVTITPPSGVVTAGSLLQLRGVPRDGAGGPLAGRVVAWSSSDTLRARVSGTGLVSGVRPGAVTITATSGGASGTALVRVVSATTSGVASISAWLPAPGAARTDGVPERAP